MKNDAYAQSPFTGLITVIWNVGGWIGVIQYVVTFMKCSEPLTATKPRDSLWLAARAYLKTQDLCPGWGMHLPLSALQVQPLAKLSMYPRDTHPPPGPLHTHIHGCPEQWQGPSAHPALLSSYHPLSPALCVPFLPAVPAAHMHPVHIWFGAERNCPQQSAPGTKALWPMPLPPPPPPPPTSLTSVPPCSWFWNTHCFCTSGWD